jgi:hypothetical protein
MTYPPPPGQDGYGQGAGGYGQSGPSDPQGPGWPPGYTAPLSGVESYWAANPAPDAPPVVPYQPPVYPPPYGSPYGYLGQYPPPQATDGFAIASLVVSCVAVLSLCAYGVGGLLGIVGAIFGHVAKRRIRAAGTGGDGLAMAGIIVGWIAAFLGLVGVGVLVTLIIMSETSSNY